MEKFIQNLDFLAKIMQKLDILQFITKLPGDIWETRKGKILPQNIAKTVFFLHFFRNLLGTL